MQARDLMREDFLDFDDLIYDKFHLRFVQLDRPRVGLNVLT
jgi:hypothetical protein